MTTKDRIAIGGLCGALLATQFEAHRILRKYNKLVEKYTTNVDDYNALMDRTQYVINKLVAALEQEGVDGEELFDEFDLIILKNMASTEETT